MARILVVDASPLQRTVLREKIEPHGHQVLEAGTAAEARQTASAGELDAVILAWELPDEPAAFTLRLWSAHERMRWVPVIVVTGRERPEIIEEALKLGAADFIRKPVQDVELMARLKAALRTRELQKELVHLARHDPLTGRFNRRAFMDRLAAEHARVRRYRRTATVVVIDVDRFKRVNDTYGHDAGDLVLRHVAEILRAGVRTVDTVARYGGEEFALLLPETPPAGAFTCVDRLRATTATTAPPGLAEGETVTFSAGIALIHPEQPNPDVALKLADGALYEAKDRGRNRVVIAAVPRVVVDDEDG